MRLATDIGAIVSIVERSPTAPPSVLFAQRRGVLLPIHTQVPVCLRAAAYFTYAVASRIKEVFYAPLQAEFCSLGWDLSQRPLADVSTTRASAALAIVEKISLRLSLGTEARPLETAAVHALGVLRKRLTALAPGSFSVAIDGGSAANDTAKESTANAVAKEIDDGVHALVELHNVGQSFALMRRCGGLILSHQIGDMHPYEALLQQCAGLQLQCVDPLSDLYTQLCTAVLSTQASACLRMHGSIRARACALHSRAQWLHEWVETESTRNVQWTTSTVRVIRCDLSQPSVELLTARLERLDSVCCMHIDTSDRRKPRTLSHSKPLHLAASSGTPLIERS